MRDKPDTPERAPPPPCLKCRSLHKKYGSSLCEKRQTLYFRTERLRAIPILGRFVGAWECDIQKYKTVRDIEREAEP